MGSLNGNMLLGFLRSVVIISKDVPQTLRPLSDVLSGTVDDWIKNALLENYGRCLRHTHNFPLTDIRTLKKGHSQI